MAKNIPILERCIKCPKCSRKTLRKSVGANCKEWFCDQCHLYFDTYELVFIYDYDYGDFGDVSAKNLLASIEEILSTPKMVVSEKITSTNWFDTVSSYTIDEPTFFSVKERDEAYEMVTRMFLDIPEWAEGTANVGIDIGIEGWPI